MWSNKVQTSNAILFSYIKEDGLELKTIIHSEWIDSTVIVYIVMVSPPKYFFVGKLVF